MQMMKTDDGWERASAMTRGYAKGAGTLRRRPLNQPRDLPIAPSGSGRDGPLHQAVIRRIELKHYLRALPADPSSLQASTTRAAIEVSASRPHERGS